MSCRYLTMKNTDNFFRFVPPGILAVSLGLVYLNSMAPGLTWANYGSDGGDLITAAATGGVAHPTGYPVYLVLAWLFQKIPLGSLAYRTSLLSAVATVLAALFVYELTIRSFLTRGGSRDWLSGLASAFAFGLSPLIWSQAVITEVYALHALFITLILYLSSNGLFSNEPGKYRGCVFGFVFGLAMGNHITTVLLLPILVAPGPVRIVDAPELNREPFSGYPANLRARLMGLGVGLLVYLILPLRALFQPALNWGNPSTLRGFAWLVTGQLYQNQISGLSLSEIWPRVQSSAALLVGQFGIPGLVVGLIGLLVFPQTSSLYRNTLWAALVFALFAIVYATADSFVYLIPVFMCFSIWIGFGLNGLMEMTGLRSSRLGIAAGIFFLFFLWMYAGKNWHQVDASRDFRAERFGEQILVKAPENAIVFAKGDKAVFTLWYFHLALKKRPDLIVVASDLLHFDWYQKSLLGTYPQLNLPGPFPFTETVVLANSAHPVCYVEYIQLPDILCPSPRGP
ncbi:MAG: DUF2723 domain-containing protein [Chloroflexi bacterium]|nr:DUF2723 domain-containing protein [Chloroflexota bacterium]